MRDPEFFFAAVPSRNQVDAIECKWKTAAFDGAALEVFRSDYPKGRNYLVSPSRTPAYTKRFGPREVRVCAPSELLETKGR